ncbi:unnamed protein product [Symbiodinium sp. CCMP2592]|nr:unnamed protein product [Symbiodinium sp. CCMP2592]
MYLYKSDFVSSFSTMQRLQLDELPGAEGFDTYKNYPAFLLDMQAFSLEAGTDAEDEAIDFQDEAVLSAAAAESEAKAGVSNLVTLHADSLAVTFEGSTLLLLPLRGDGKEGLQTFLLPARIVSLGHARSSKTSIQQDEVILVSLIGGWLHAIQVSRDGQCRTWCRTQLDTKRNFLSAALIQDSSVTALVYRAGHGEATDMPGYIELMALQLDEHAPEEAKPLWVAHGPHPPHAAHWETAHTGFLVASGGFELAGAGDGPTLQTEDAVCTVFRMEPAAQAEMRSWLLPRGDVLSCTEHVSGLEVALAHNSQGALLFRMVLESEGPALLNAALIPGAAACAAAREPLQTFAVSPDRGFFVLVDGSGGASVFRCPDPSTSSSRSPTVTVSLESVRATKLLESSLLMRTKQGIVRCKLNMSAKVEGAKRELVSRELMPLGMDPKALLRMLDMQGED